MTIEEEVVIIVADTFGLPLSDVTPTDSQETIEGWDSFQQLNLIVALEQRLDLQFDLDEIERMISIPAIKTCVQQKRDAVGV